MKRHGSFVKVFALALVLSLMAALLAGCGGNQASSSSAAGGTSSSSSQPAGSSSTDGGEATGPVEKQTLKIGIATCFTGPSARAAEIQLLGLEVALQQIEASGFSEYYDFELIQGDDQYDATEAVNVANKLVYQDGVKLVFGHLNGVVTMAASGIYNEAKVPFMMPSFAMNLTAQGYEYAYRVCPNDYVMAETCIEWLLNEKGMENIGLLYANNEQGQSAQEMLTEAMTERGAEFAREETFLVGDQDFTGQLLNFKAANVDTVIIWGGESTQRHIMVQQIRQLVGDVLITGDTLFSQATYQELSTPEEREGVTYCAAYSPSVGTELSNTYIEDYMAIDPGGQVPGDVSVRFYDGMWLAATALNALGAYDVDADDFTEKFNEKLKEVSFDGLQGHLQATENGECVSKAYVIEFIADGEMQVIF